MLKTPATEKMREKLRKYHFRPSQSMFAFRNSSTFLILAAVLAVLLGSCDDVPGEFSGGNG
jgi:hypothetical protein